MDRKQFISTLVVLGYKYYKPLSYQKNIAYMQNEHIRIHILISNCVFQNRITTVTRNMTFDRAMHAITTGVIYRIMKIDLNDV